MMVAFGPMLLLVRVTPDKIPADAAVEEQERAWEKKKLDGIGGDEV